MNIFRNTDAFYGDEDRRVTEVPLLSIFRLAKRIRLQLGPKGYLLDNYLGLVLQGLDMATVSEAVEDGVNASYDLHRRLLCPITEDTEPKPSHPLCDRAREVYEQYPAVRSFQEPRTRAYLLMALLGDEPLVPALSDFIAQKKKTPADLGEVYSLQELYESICGFVDESLLEELNRQLLQRFQIVSMRASFLQGCANDLLYQLTWRDLETSKQIFQLLLDLLPEEG